MKKMPTLFHREFQGHQVIHISPEVGPGLEWVLNGEGIATEKTDGACCAVIEGKFYKRYDAKKNKMRVMKMPPPGAIPCDDPDPVTGHWPHWVLVDERDPADRWFAEAYKAACAEIPEAVENGILPEATYEAVGPHFQGNPYKLTSDIRIRHGSIVIDLPDRSFSGIQGYLKNHKIEGIVFWKDGQPVCKIKRKDFGFKWPIDKDAASESDPVGKNAGQW